MTRPSEHVAAGVYKSTGDLRLPATGRVGMVDIRQRRRGKVKVSNYIDRGHQRALQLSERVEELPPHGDETD